jgi:hypothetical protein
MLPKVINSFNLCKKLNEIRSQLEATQASHTWNLEGKSAKKYEI